MGRPINFFKLTAVPIEWTPDSVYFILNGLTADIYVTDVTGDPVLAGTGEGGGGDFVPTSRTITINSVAHDLTTDPSWTVSGGGGVGTLQQVTDLGATTDNTITITDGVDSISLNEAILGQNVGLTFKGGAARATSHDEYQWLKVDPIQQGQEQTPFVFNIRSTANPPSARNNEIMTFGWNLNGGGNLIIGGVGGLGESWESGYTSNRWFEKHEFYITPEGTQKRISSYTIKGPTDIDFYHTTSNFYIKSASDVNYIPYAISWGTGAGNVAGNVNFTFDAGAGTTFSWYYDNQGIQLSSVGALKIFYQNQMDSVVLPGMTSYKAGGSLYNQSGHILPYLGQDAVFSVGLTGTRYLNVFTYTVDAGTIKNANFAGTGVRPVGVTADGTFTISGLPVQQNADWNASSGVTQILNKPSIPTQYTDEMAQDAFAAMASSEFTYVDATPLLSINAIAQSKITGLVSALAAKADLVAGIVPSAQLPASIVGIVSVANFASLPGTGAANTIYITTDNNKRYIWTTSYIELGATPPVTSVNSSTGDVVITAASISAVPTSRSLTINGVALDLSANRSWTVGDLSSNTSSSVDNEVMLFSGTAGKTSKRATSTGIPKLTSGVLSVAVAGDFPTLNQSTTGTASNVTGTVLIANGGTGQTTASAAFNALSPATTLGDLIYGSGTNTNTRLAGNTTTTKKFLVQTGSSGVSAAPVWDVITTFDVPTLNQNTTGTASNITGVLNGTSFPALTGDVTTTIGNLATTIANNVVTLAKFQTVATGTVLGRNTASTGNIEVLTILPTAVMPAFTGDVTSSAGALALTIANSAVTYAKMQNVSATAKILGRFGAGAGVVQELTISTGLSVDGSGNLTSSGGGGVTDGDKGDITVSSTGSVWTIDNNVITLAKFQQVATATVLGRNTAATGNIEVLTTLPTGVMPAFAGGDVTSSAGSLVLTVATNAVSNAKAAQMAANTMKGNNTGSTANAADLTVVQTLTLLGASSGKTAIVANSAAINTTETNLTNFSIAANTLQVGTTFKVSGWGTCTSTVANASNIRVRLGTANSTADAVAAVITPTAATSGTTIAFRFELYVTIRTTGSGGTMGGNGVLINNGATGITSAATGNVVGAPQVGIAVNTTVTNTISLWYVAAATTTTSTFNIATIELVKP